MGQEGIELDQMDVSGWLRWCLGQIITWDDGQIICWVGQKIITDDADVRLNCTGNTPLHLAARAGRTKTVSSLLNLGASPNMKVGTRKQHSHPHSLASPAAKIEYFQSW